jgi:hypothetical protein
MRRIACCAGLVSALGLSACAVAPPSGPTVMALPKQGESLQSFEQDDAMCRLFAQQQTGGAAPAQAATNSAIGSAALGTALGAAAGAALGSLGGAVGTGAAVGGVTGLVAGGAIGAGNAQASGLSLQQRYDTAYTQCMYSKGNTVQSPPGGYAYNYGYSYPYGYGYAYPYSYGYPYPYYYTPGFYSAPTVTFGFGGGWGGGWHRRHYWHGW